MAWVRQLAMTKVEGQSVHLVPLPGHREILGFMTPPRQAQLAALLGEILGHSVRVSVAAPPLDAGAGVTGSPSAAPAADAGAPRGPRAPLPARPSFASAMASRPASPPPGQASADRDKVLNLPLVRQLMELFDASIVDVRAETAATESQATAPAAEAGPGSTVPAAPDVGGDADEMPLPEEEDDV